MEIDANSYDSKMLTLKKVKYQNWIIEKKSVANTQNGNFYKKNDNF